MDWFAMGEQDLDYPYMYPFSIMPGNFLALQMGIKHDL